MKRHNATVNKGPNLKNMLHTVAFQSQLMMNYQCETYTMLLCSYIM